MKRFYLSWIQEGTTTLQDCHKVIEAESWSQARKNWQNVVGQPGVSLQSLNQAPPTALFELPAFMRDWSSERVLKHYYEVSFKNQWTAPENQTPFSRMFPAVHPELPERFRKILTWRPTKRLLPS